MSIQVVGGLQSEGKGDYVRVKEGLLKGGDLGPRVFRTDALDRGMISYRALPSVTVHYSMIFTDSEAEGE